VRESEREREKERETREREREREIERERASERESERERVFERERGRAMAGRWSRAEKRIASLTASALLYRDTPETVRVLVQTSPASQTTGAF